MKNVFVGKMILSCICAVFFSGSLFADTLLPGKYEMREGRHTYTVEVSSSLAIKLVNYEIDAPSFGTDDDGEATWFNFSVNFPHRLSWDAANNSYTARGTMGGYVYNDYCEYSISLKVKAFEESKELELTLRHPIRLYDVCASFDVAEKFLTAKAIP